MTEYSFTRDARSDTPADAPPRVSGLAPRIAAFFAVAASLLLAMMLVLANLSYNAALERAGAQARSVALLVANQASDIIYSADLLLMQMERLAVATRWDDPGAVEAATARLHEFKAVVPSAFRLFIIDAGGAIRATSVGGIDPSINVMDRAYFQVHAAGSAGLFLSEPMRAKIDDRPIFVLSRRVDNPDGSFGGIVSVSFEPRELSQFYTELGIGEGATFIWVREDGRVLVREPPVAPAEGEASDAGRLDDAVMAELRRSAATGSPNYRLWIDDTERIGFAQKIDHHPLYIAVGMPRDAVTTAWRQDILPYSFGALLAFLGLCLAAAFTLRGSRAEDGYRQELAILNGRLREANAELERRVVERTESLTQALAQKELLFKEVNHRVKNSLQLVSALLQMQGRTVVDAAARTQFGEAVARVQAVARVHEQLYQTDRVNSVEAASYLGALGQELERSSLAENGLWRVEVEAPPMELPTDRAVPIGLIVNELVTNVFKHGRPLEATQTGWTVQVSLTPTPDGRHRLAVRDFGPGLPEGVSLDQFGSLGMRIVTALAKQIGGEMVVERADPGARFVVTF